MRRYVSPTTKSITLTGEEPLLTISYILVDGSGGFDGSDDTDDNIPVDNTPGGFDTRKSIWEYNWTTIFDK